MAISFKVEQIYPIVNEAANQALGREDISVIDCQNLVDIGEAITATNNTFDAFLGGLLPRVNEVYMDIRKYSGVARSLMMTGREYGVITQFIDFEMPDSEKSNSWDLQAGTVYNGMNEYKPLKTNTKVYTDREAKTIRASITRRQLKGAFASLAELDAFIAGLFMAIDNRITFDEQNMRMLTLDNLIAETIYNEFDDGDYAGTGVRAVNLLYEYNQTVDTPLDSAAALRDKNFLRFAAEKMKNVKNRLSAFSTLYNLNGKEKFTDEEYLKIFLLNDFVNACEMNMQADTFHDTLVALPNADIVPYWQGSGDDYSFEKVSDIHINTADNHEVVCAGIVGVMFDRYAAGVRMLEPSIRTQYNADGDFVQYYYDYAMGHFNNFNQNCVVFFIGDYTES